MSVAIEISELRSYVAERSGNRCEFPGCSERFMEMAHVTHRGMGGGASRNTRDNVLGFCRDHHYGYDNGTMLEGSYMNLLAAVTTRDEGCDWTRCVYPSQHRWETPIYGMLADVGYRYLCDTHDAVVRDVHHPYRRMETRLLLVALVGKLRTAE